MTGSPILGRKDRCILNICGNESEVYKKEDPAIAACVVGNVHKQKKETLEKQECKIVCGCQKILRNACY